MIDFVTGSCRRLSVSCWHCAVKWNNCRAKMTRWLRGFLSSVSCVLNETCRTNVNDVAQVILMIASVTPHQPFIFSEN